MCVHASSECNIYADLRKKHQHIRGVGEAWEIFHAAKEEKDKGAARPVGQGKEKLVSLPERELTELGMKRVGKKVPVPDDQMTKGGRVPVPKVNTECVLGGTQEVGMRQTLSEDEWVEFVRRRVNSPALFSISDVLSIALPQTNSAANGGRPAGGDHCRNTTCGIDGRECQAALKSNKFIPNKSYTIKYDSVEAFMYRDGVTWIPEELREGLRKLDGDVGCIHKERNELRLMEYFSDTKEQYEGVEVRGTLTFFTFAVKWRDHLRQFNKVFQIPGCPCSEWTDNPREFQRADYWKRAWECPTHSLDIWRALWIAAQEGNWELRVYNQMDALSLEWGNLSKHLMTEYKSVSPADPNVSAAEQESDLRGLASSTSRVGLCHCAIHNSWTHRTLDCPYFKAHLKHVRDSPVRHFEEQLLVYWDMHGKERIQHNENLQREKVRREEMKEDRKDKELSSTSSVLHEDGTTSDGNGPAPTGRDCGGLCEVGGAAVEVITLDEPLASKDPVEFYVLADVKILKAKIIPEYTRTIMILDGQSSTNKGLGVQVNAMVDCGATTSWVTPQLLADIGVTFRPSATRIRLGNSSIVSSKGKGQLTIQYGTLRLRSWFEVLDLPRHQMILGRDLIDALALWPDNPVISTRVCPMSSNSVEAPKLGTEEEKEFTPAQMERRDRLLVQIETWVTEHVQKVPLGGVCNHPAAPLPIVHGQRHYSDPTCRYKKQYKQPTDREAWISKGVQEWLKWGFAEIYDRNVHGNLLYNSPIFGVPSFDENGNIVKMRNTFDIKHLNLYLKDIDMFKLPEIKGILERCSKGKIFSEIDLKNAFFQLPVCPEDVHKLQFTWDDQHYVFNRAPMGMTHVPSHFSRLMHAMFAHLPFLEIFLDNLWIITGRDVDEIEMSEEELEVRHLSQIKQVMDVLNQYNLSINGRNANG